MYNTGRPEVRIHGGLIRGVQFGLNNKPNNYSLYNVIVMFYKYNSLHNKL